MFTNAHITIPQGLTDERPNATKVHLYKQIEKCWDLTVMFWEETNYQTPDLSEIVIFVYWY